MPASKHPQGSGIYAIENIINGRVYYGQGTFKHRWNQHTASLRRGAHHNKALQADWLKYGEDAFRFFVVEELPRNADKNLTYRREVFHIVSSEREVYNVRSTSKFMAEIRGII